MQGKRTAGVLALAIVATLGLAVAPGFGAKAKKVASELEVDGWYYDADDNDQVFVGDVHANKPKCEKNRTVTVTRNDGPGNQPPDESDDEQLGEVTTDATGDWEFTIQTNGGDSPNFVTATVTKKKVTKQGGKKLKCQADEAPYLPSD